MAILLASGGAVMALTSWATATVLPLLAANTDHGRYQGREGDTSYYLIETDICTAAAGEDDAAAPGSTDIGPDHVESGAEITGVGSGELASTATEIDIDELGPEESALPETGTRR